MSLSLVSIKFTKNLPTDLIEFLKVFSKYSVFSIKILLLNKFTYLFMR